jgi:hypothetical protein
MFIVLVSILLFFWSYIGVLIGPTDYRFTFESRFYNKKQLTFKFICYGPGVWTIQIIHSVYNFILNKLS